MAELDSSTRIARHVANTHFADLPPLAVDKMKTFLLDTIGVGIAGSSGAQIAELKQTVRSWGDAPEATVWLSGEQMSAQSAAIVNAYQIHCQEFDCVHEGAVLHPMATILSAVFAWLEREKTRGRTYSGSELLTALVVGIDISTMLGIVSNAGLRFFRPATAGGFGAAAAIAKLAGFDETQVKNVLGAQYSQASGTLQAHLEASPMLGLQVGMNARAAITSADLTQAGFRAPHDVFTGRYGYFALFEENNYDLEPFLDRLGQDFQVLEMAHKPYPSGRLTHGAVDGLGRLMRQYALSPDDFATISVKVPPLVYRLVGRPDIAHPEPNYAKLCLPFVTGVYLSRGHVDIPDFLGRPALDDPKVHEIAARVSVVLDENNPDQNAFTPQVVSAVLKDGRSVSVTLDSVYGDPRMPLTDDENIDKFMRCVSHGAVPLPADRARTLIDAVRTLETIKDASLLARMTTAEDL